ncbi:MAG: tetratricopeptide repeat protein [Paracoccaceae bacterium]
MTEQTADQLLQKARSHEAQQYFEEARRLYEAVLEAAPGSPQAQQAFKALTASKAKAEVVDPPKEMLKEIVVLYNQRQLDAVAEKASALVEDFPSSFVLWNIIGVASAQLGQLDRAIEGFHKASELNPEFPDAYSNLGNAYKAQGKLGAAVASFARALALKPDFAEAYNNLGIVLQDQGKLEEAAARYKNALELKSDYAEAYNNLGSVLQELRKFDEAVENYARALAITPGNTVARSQKLYQMAILCDWSATAEFETVKTSLGIEGTKIPPFTVQSYEDHPQRQLDRARLWAKESYKQRPAPLPAAPQSRPDKLRVGFFSADFHDHPVLQLMAGLFRSYDRSRFELSAFSYGRRDGGERRAQLIRDVDQFYDISQMSDRDVLDTARSANLDIAIDLTGYTKNTRTALFSLRLAPIQINYLGYPGTLGADFIDYIIADPVVIPANQQQFYSEKTISLPHSYLPMENQMALPETKLTKADYGLPEEGFVFCCLNNSYKLGSREFEIWMRLLGKVEGSVLWLQNANESATKNLRKEAAKHNIDPERLVFTQRLSHEEHLARYNSADLFLDTFTYNAHTTALEALWAGLPVVTKAGQQFAARVAASLLDAVGLPELITESEEAYEALILELATNPEHLSEIRARLAANRTTMPLFDTERYTRNFETGLQMAYDRYFEGKAPADIVVPSTGSNGANPCEISVKR